MTFSGSRFGQERLGAPAFGPPAALSSRRRSTLLIETALVSAISLVLLLGFQLYVDNVFIVTTNGLWKSVLVRHWADHPNPANLDLANVLYYPVYGLLVRLLDALGVFPGLTWKQMAVLNAGFAAAALGAIYWWISAWFGTRRIALPTVLFYLGSGHFLTLSAINEDIMPGYFFVLVGMMLAAAWFGRATPHRILATALVVSLGWLFEWRLLFPVVPPMLLALWLCARDGKQRIGWSLCFLLGLALLPLMITVVVAGLREMDRPEATAFLGRLFWVGKGVGTGWAGFSPIKLQLTWVGMTESVLGGRYIQSDDWLRHPLNLLEVGAGSMLLLILAVTAVRYVWPRRRDKNTLALAVVFAGTFLAGEVFNVYSQPQDPQMQLNVMPWIIPAWGMLLTRWFNGAERGPGKHVFRRRDWFAGPAAVAASLIPMAFTVPVIAGERGGNARYLAVLERLERQVEPSRTLFLYIGFDAVIPWQFVQWGATWPDLEHLPPASEATPNFKWLSITDGLIRHRDWTSEQQAAELFRQIDRALGSGYRVVTNRLWVLPEQKWIEITQTVASPEIAPAIRQALLSRYRAEPVYVDPVEGPFFRLSPRGEPVPAPGSAVP